MYRRIALCFVMICLLAFVLPAANLRDLAVRETSVASDAITDAGNRIHLAQNHDKVLLAYQGKDGNVHLATSQDNVSWTSAVIPQIPNGNVQGLAANGDLVVIGYGDQGQLFTVSSHDGGESFLAPVAVTPPRRNASIQDMVIDGNGVIHIMYHRHDSYWDYNHAKSFDNGMSYRVTQDFTGAYDSNSTGYYGNLQAIHGNLYTVYQDNNDSYAVKLGVSQDGGDSWTITRLAPSSGGKLALSVDPEDPDLVHVAAFNNDGLTILRIEDATSSPKPRPVYGDGSLVPTKHAVVSVHLATSADKTITAILLNPVTGSYHLLSSVDAGESWEDNMLTSLLTPTNYLWSADLLAVGNEFLFARHDGRGGIIIHGPKIARENQIVYTPDSIGLVELPSIDKPFSVVMNSGMPMVLFSVPEDGGYKISHLSQDTIPLYLALYDLNESADTELAENFDGETLYDQIEYDLSSDTVYLLALGILDDSTLGMQAHFSISQRGLKPTSVAATPSTFSLDAETGDRVAAGKFNSFFIGSSGMIFATGLNSWGQFADGGTDYKKAFTPIRSKVADVVGGHGHTLYIADDRILYASGRNADGQIGDGTTNDRLSLFRLADSVISAGAGYGHTLFVQADGSVWALGANNRGQLGDGTTSPRMKPVKIFEGAQKVFSNMRNSSFILTPEGVLYGFGDNNEGQLGLGPQTTVLQPTYIMGGVWKVVGGNSHTLVLLRDGTVWASGENGQGQLGTGTRQSSTRFIKVAEGVKDIATCDYSSFLVMDDGTLKAAGSNKYGEFGTNNNRDMTTSPTFIPVFSHVADVAGGKNHVVVLTEDGVVWTTGLNDNYQLGDTTQGYRPTWEQVFKF